MLKALFVLSSLLLFAACSGDTHVLTGTWSQELPDGKAGVSLEFNATGDKVVVHGAPRADGGHGHPKFKPTWDLASKTLTLTRDGDEPLVEGSKAETWTGKLVGDHLELSSADGKLVFHRGGKPHGH